MVKLLEHSEAEARIELLDGHCEVFEHIYEMVRQRLGEFRASRQTERVEWIIIGLLAGSFCSFWRGDFRACEELPETAVKGLIVELTRNQLLSVAYEIYLNVYHWFRT